MCRCFDPCLSFMSTWQYLNFPWCAVTDLYLFHSRGAKGTLALNCAHGLHRMRPEKKVHMQTLQMRSVICTKAPLSITRKHIVRRIQRFCKCSKPFHCYSKPPSRIKREERCQDKLSKTVPPSVDPNTFLPSHTTTAGGCHKQSQDKHPSQSHLRGIKDSPPPLLF